MEWYCTPRTCAWGKICSVIVVIVVVDTKIPKSGDLGTWAGINNYCVWSYLYLELFIFICDSSVALDNRPTN